MISREEVYESTMEYFDGDELKTNVWMAKYCLKDKSGNLLENNPDDMFRRIAKELWRIESAHGNTTLSEEIIYEAIKEFGYIIPGGSPLAGIGNNNQVTSLSNCFVVESAEDSYGGIMKVDQEQVQLMKRRGGVGHDLSPLRPVGAIANGAPLKGDAGMTLYMNRFSYSTREVAQDGRRGALMLSVSVKHPDTDKFVDIKMEEGKVTGANISVKMTDEFMESVIGQRDFIQSFPVEANHLIDSGVLMGHAEYGELHKGALGYFKKIKAKELWDKIIHNAWKSAEPGILFWDQIERESPADQYGGEWKSTSTNPCGEIPLCPYDSCRLLAVNLFRFVDNPFTEKAKFNFAKFKHYVTIAQRMMDNIVDLEAEKIEKIIQKVKGDPESEEVKAAEITLWEKVKDMTLRGRRTGLGITGEGDMVAALGLTYGTVEATDFCEDVHKVMAVESYKSSIDMAVERGHFSEWDYEMEFDNPFVMRIMSELEACGDNDYIEKYLLHGRRNIANLTIAPTGTISLLADVTSGIEPCFMPAYKRRRKIDDKTKADFIDEVGDAWEEYFVLHKNFALWYLCNGELCSMKEVVEYLGGLSDEDMQTLIEKSPYHKACSNDVDWLEKVRMQGRIQKWIDHSISVTVNVPKETKEEVIGEIYIEAWKSGCKGCTVYRDGSRSGVLITDDGSADGFPEDRPKSVDCDIHHLTVKGVKWIVLVGIINGRPYEVFAYDVTGGVEDIPKKFTKGKLIKNKSRNYSLEIEGDGTLHDLTKEFSSPIEGALTRLISLSLKHTPLEDVYIQLQKEGGVSDFNKAISRVFKKYLVDKDLGKQCPNEGCDGELRIQEGCVICPECGYSHCG